MCIRDRGAFLQSKDGTRSVSVSTLSSALSSIKNNMTSVAYSIQMCIRDRLYAVYVTKQNITNIQFIFAGDILYIPYT